MELEEVRWVVRFSRQTSLGQHPCNLQEQMTWEKKLYDAFLLSLQDPKLTFWLPVFTKVSYGSCNRRKGYYTDGAPFAKWLWSLMIMHLSMVLPEGGGGQSSLGVYVGMVHWICWHLLPIFSPGWRTGLLLQFYSRIPEEKTPAGICYAPSRNGSERE